MKLFVVEDDLQYFTELLQAFQAKRWQQYTFPLGENHTATEESVSRFLRQLCEVRPDVVVLDAALNEREAKILDNADSSGVVLSDQNISGFRYCQALANERLHIPIVLLTKYAFGEVARAAIRMGADRVMAKKGLAADTVHDIEDFVKSRAPHDPAFYWLLKRSLEDDTDVWRREVMLRALDRFFLNAPAPRRLSLFTASLRPVLGQFAHGDADVERRLMLNLVRTQSFLSAVDPQLRDHVKHTGNVFWMGYYLLHEIGEFKTPEGLTGCKPALYDPLSDLTPREQLMSAWTLASLFHDLGYVDERRELVDKLVRELVEGAHVSCPSIPEESWKENLSRLRDFAARILGGRGFLVDFMDWAIASFGESLNCRGAGGTRAKLLDHGFLGAHRLLNMIPVADLDAEKQNVVQHAALAIACHNYTDIVRKWEVPSNCEGTLSVGVFPTLSLLALCDAVQTWDRELEVDPALTWLEAHDGLLERLVLGDAAHVSGSEIKEFNVARNRGTSGYDLKLALRYFVDAAKEVDSVCESLRDGITKWKESRRLNDVCNTMGISELLHGHITYQLPMRFDPVDVAF